MPIHIEEINARGLGPLDEFSGKLGKFNLIYGRNEQGKTFLVEFLLKSLFKNLNLFKLRNVSPSGTVQISGLGKESYRFSPSSREKLEDFWSENFPGMPPNIAQLLVVKGAELEFVDTTPSGVSKTVIKSFLSSERTLELIQNKIQTTVQESILENGEILGSNRGELKHRNSSLDKLKQIENTIRKVDEEYSSGGIVALHAKEKTLKEKISQQENAKRYLAYVCSTKVDQIEQEIQHIEESGFQNLVENYTEFLRRKDELRKLQEKLETANKKSEHYEWLTSAIEDYGSFLSQGTSPVSRVNLVLALIFTVIAIAISILGFLLYLLSVPIIDAVFYCFIGVAIVLGTVFGFLYLRNKQKKEGMLAQSQELKRIESSYEDKFGKPLSDISTLRSHQKMMQKYYYEAQTLADELTEINSEIELLKNQIQNGFEKLNNTYEDESNWADLIEQLEEAYSISQKQLQEVNIELANLDVKTENYLETDPEIQYDRSELANLKNELQEVHEQIQDEEQDLDLLKTEIRAAISDRTSITWEDLLGNLRQYRFHQLEEYKEITSKILAGSLVSQVIQDAHEQEDEKIKATLHSSIVQKPLFEITKKYDQVTFDGENLQVSDKYEEFDIADLSTAAREQVLLALRLGFAAKIMNQQTAFLILDDAFQHSDWLRRNYLLNTVTTLAKRGWQIIYFSMDDHIRNLFKKQGTEIFKEDFYYYELPFTK